MKSSIKNASIPVIIALFFLAGAGFIPHKAHSQSIISDSDISVGINPQIPGPLQDVTISLTSFATDLNMADVSWSVNGKTVLSGTGKTEYSLKTGVVGATLNMTISITINGVPAIIKNVIIQPLETNLLWEAADSYVPPFYKGKAMPSSEATIKVVAIPNIKTENGIKLKPGDFSYSWKRNYTVDQTDSGFGKNSCSCKGSYLKNEEKISAIASSLDNHTSESTVSITTGNPKIIFYENNPADGIKYEQALNGTFSLKNDSVIIAEPYFFSPKDPNSDDLSYKWQLNSQDISTPERKNSLPLKPGGQSGSANLSLIITSVSKLFESASGSLYLKI